MVNGDTLNLFPRRPGGHMLTNHNLAYLERCAERAFDREHIRAGRVIDHIHMLPSKSHAQIVPLPAKTNHSALVCFAGFAAEEGPCHKRLVHKARRHGVSLKSNFRGCSQSAVGPGMVALTQPCIKLRIQLLQALRWMKSNLGQECLQSLVEPLLLAFALRISGLRIQ